MDLKIFKSFSTKKTIEPDDEYDKGYYDEDQNELNNLDIDPETNRVTYKGSRSYDFDEDSKPSQINHT